MTASYRLVQWNRHKRVYDLFVVGAVVGIIGVVVGIGALGLGGESAADPAVLVMRALGITAAVLLQFLLCIGPLSRLDSRFSALLYNRRHLGVVMFFVALLHGLLVLGYYGGFGVVNPISAVLIGGVGVAGVPFEWFGFGALLILFVLAATSHDFWLANLGARFWKWMHMLVYVAFGLVVLHEVFGGMADRGGVGVRVLVLGGAGVVVGLHLAAVFVRDIPEVLRTSEDGWVEGPALDELAESGGCAVKGSLGENLAVIRHDGRVYGMSNVCAHQGGPLGEGKVVDGCLTCPWHGYQYRVENGKSPPPYTEKVCTHEVRIEGGRVFVRSRGNELGTVSGGVALPEIGMPDASDGGSRADV